MAKKLIYTENKYLHYRQDNASSSVKQCALAKVKFVHMEYNEADQYLKRFPERYALIETIYNTKKLKTFFGTYTELMIRKVISRLWRKQVEESCVITIMRNVIFLSRNALY